MRVLLLTQYWEPEIGAPQRRWQWLARTLTEAGHELAVLAPAPHYPHGHLLSTDPRHQVGAVCRDASGAMVHRVSFRPYDGSVGGRGIDQTWAMADAVRAGLARFSGVHRPDIVIGTVPGIPSLAAACTLGALWRRPVIAEMRDAWPDILDSSSQWSAVATDDDATAGPAQRSVFSRATTAGRDAAIGVVSSTLTTMQRRVSGVITTTDAFAQVLRDRGVDRVCTIRNTARLATLDVRELPTQREDGALHVLYLGTVGRAQSVETGVRAAARLKDRGLNIVMRVVGEGAHLESVRSLARHLDAPVKFLPLVPPREVAEQYTWADTVLVALQNWPAMELTVPSKLYEVMATGRHMSVAVAGEAARIITESGTGSAVPPADPHALADLWAGLATDRSRLRIAPAAGSAWLADHANPAVLGQRFVTFLEEVAHHV